MTADTKSLWRAIFLNSIGAFGYVSTAATFLPWLTAYRRYIWSLSGVLILIGAFRGALKVIAAKSERIGKIELDHEAEIGKLNQRIEELQRDPFDDDVKARVRSELSKFDEKERSVLKNLLHYDSWDYNKTMPGLACTVQEQTDVFRKGYGAGLLTTEEVQLGGHRRMHYKPVSNYREALRKYLYETPRNS